MFQIGNSVDSSHTAPIAQDLLRQPLQLNRYRTNSGDGRSQCFGLVRQRNGTYTGSRLNFNRPELYQMLIRLGNEVLPHTFSYTSIQLNMNYQTKAHKDKGNRGISAIIGFGDYIGGDLVIEDTPVSIKDRIVFFDGSQYTHHTASYTQNRFSIVFFTIDKDFAEVPVFGFTEKNKKMLLTESMGGIIRIYDRKGNCIDSSDGVLLQRKARCPTLRPCIE
jgi:hypothetical protein